MEEYMVRIKHETDAAYLVTDSDQEGEEFWLPKSQVEVLDDESEIYKNKGCCRMGIPDWLAKEKGMI